MIFRIESATRLSPKVVSLRKCWSDIVNFNPPKQLHFCGHIWGENWGDNPQNVITRFTSRPDLSNKQGRDTKSRARLALTLSPALSVEAPVSSYWARILHINSSSVIKLIRNTLHLVFSLVMFLLLPSVQNVPLWSVRGSLCRIANQLCVGVHTWSYPSDSAAIQQVNVSTQTDEFYLPANSLLLVRVLHWSAGSIPHLLLHCVFL